MEVHYLKRLSSVRRWISLLMAAALLVTSLLPQAPAPSVSAADEAEVIAGWTNFSAGNMKASSGIAENLGNDSTAVSSFSTGSFSYSAGPAAGNSAVSATGWVAGTSYWQVSFATTGYSEIQLSSKQISSNTGPKTFQLQYCVAECTVETNWLEVGETYNVGSSSAPADWTTGALSGIHLPNAADKPSVSVRWKVAAGSTAVNGNAIGTSGTSRIADIYVTGVPIGETPTNVSGLPTAMNLQFDGRNQAASIVTGVTNAVYGGALVELFLDDPSGNATVVNSTYAAGDGSFVLTFDNTADASSVYVTAKEPGKERSTPVSLNKAVVSPNVDAGKVTFTVDATGMATVAGLDGAVAASTNQTFVSVYNGDPANGGTPLTQSGGTFDGQQHVMATSGGAFQFKFDNSALDLETVYVVQTTWSMNGRNFPSAGAAVAESDDASSIVTPIASVRAGLNNETGAIADTNKVYTIEGTATIKNNVVGGTNNNFYIQDETGGINIYSGVAHGLTINQGDKVRITGKLAFFNGLTELVPTAVEKLDGGSLPTPVQKTLTELTTFATAEPVEGTLVTVKAKISAIPATAQGGGYNISIADEEGKSMTLRLMTATGIDVATLEVGSTYTFTGIFAQFDNNSPYTSGYQLFPRTAEDIVKEPEIPSEQVPLIYQVHPAKMVSTKNTKPVISGKVEKTANDLDWSTFKLLIDDTAVAGVTPNATTGVFSYTPAEDLAFGEHKLTIEIADVTGNKNTLTHYFLIQKTIGDESYNFYFGVPHAHTSYSDGKGTPAEAFQHAYNQGLDFLMVTDHSNQLNGDTYVTDKNEFQEKVGSEWHATKEQAAAFNAAHSDFLAMRGFEMTFSSYGHSNVFGTDNYIERTTVTALDGFYNWLTKQEGVFAAFNHPNWPNDSFNDLSYAPEIDHIMTMIEVGNGAPPYSYARSEGHYFKALDNGWHVGANNAQDNHSANWGEPDNLTVVIAEDLTQESFMEAFKSRRFYSTEARDTELRVKANGYWMGSVLDVDPGTELTFDIWTKDASNPIDKIELYTNGGVLVETKQIGGQPEAVWAPKVTTGSGASWYVVKVIHSDGKWTTASPIFVAGGEMDVKMTNLEINPSPALPGSVSKVTATISNMGVRPVSDLEVKFYKETVAPANLIGTGTLNYVAPNKNGKVTVDWTPAAAGQTRIVAKLTEKPGITTVTEMNRTVKVVASNGKKVLVDKFHNNADVPGTMLDFMEMMRRYGYKAEFNEAEFTSEKLAGYDVLVINSPDGGKYLTNAEIEAISAWVKAGGSLMLASKSNYGFDNTSYTNPLLETLGSKIHVNNDNVYEPNTSSNYSGGMKWSVYARTVPSAPSGLNDDIEAIRYFSGSSLVGWEKSGDTKTYKPLVNDPSSELEVLVAGNKESYNFNVAPGFYTYNSAIGGENDPNQTSGTNGDQIPLIAKEKIGNGKIIVAGRHFYSDYEIPNDVSNTAFTLKLIDWLADYDRIQTVQEVRANAKSGDIYTVEGVVTAPTNKFFDTVYIQDETGGISLYGTFGQELPIGTRVVATGGVEFFEGELELSFESSDMEILYVGPSEPKTTRTVTLKEVHEGAYPGQLVRTVGKIVEINESGSYFLLSDGVNTARIFLDGYLPLDTGRFEVGDTISAAGIQTAYSEGNRIRVRFAEDLELLAEADDFQLRVLHTNDTHARLDNVPKRITAINELRTDNSILLDAGDVFSGTLYFTKFEGMADLEFMNMADYDAMVPGNHEFDKGPAALERFIKAANFPIVSANIDYSANAGLSAIYKNEIGGNDSAIANGHIYPSVVLDVYGEKVGVFGLTTEETKGISSPGDTIQFQNYIDQAKSTVAALKAAGIDKIVALTHIGYTFDLALADEVEGIDIIVGGHSHTTLTQPVVRNAEEEPTVIVQTGEYGANIGVLDATFDDAGVVKTWQGQLVSVANKAEDPAAKTKLAAYKAQVDAMMLEVVGKTNVDLVYERTNPDGSKTRLVRKEETNLGNLITDGIVAAMKEKITSLLTPSELAEIKGYVAIQNGGGIRAGIPAGDITMGQVRTLMPYDNSLVAVKVTGAELILALENGVSRANVAGTAENGGFPHVSGMRFFYDSTKAAQTIDQAAGTITSPGERIRQVQIKNANGTYSAIDPNAYYMLGTNSFMADGGDFYYSLKQAKNAGRQYQLFMPDFEVFIEHLNRVGNVTIGTEGRITDLKGQPIPGEDQDPQFSAALDRSSLKLNEIATLTVKAEDVTNLNGFEIYVEYDASKFEFDNAVVRTEFGTGSNLVFETRNVNGVLRLVGTLTGSAPRPSGDVGLVDVKFKAIAEGAGTFRVTEESALSVGDNELKVLEEAISIPVKVGETAEMSIENVQGIVEFGKELDIEVFGSVASLKNFTIKLTYDPNKFTVKSASLGEKLANYQLTMDSSTPGFITLTGAGATPVTDETLKYVTVTFQAKSAAGMADFTLQEGSNYTNVSNVKHNLGEAATVAVPVANTDVSDDGVLRINDVTAVANRFGLQSGETGYMAKYDMNLDGVINIFDLTFIMRALLDK